MDAHCHRYDHIDFKYLSIKTISRERTMKKFLIVASLGLALYLPYAEAEEFIFSYNDSADGLMLTGIINGTLQADNNTVAISSFQDLSLNGMTGTAVPYVYNSDLFYSQLYPANYPIQPGFPTESTAWATLDGSYMNFNACTSTDCSDGFMFMANDSLQQILGSSYFMAGTSYGFVMTGYDQTSWQMSAVPLPSAVWIFLSGWMGLLGLARQRYQA
jgi:hypothetical protein